MSDLIKDLGFLQGLWILYTCCDERLALFDLDRLELRRLHFDLLHMFKIVHGFTVCGFFSDLHFAHSDNVYNTRGHRFKLHVNRTNKNIFKYCFINRVLPIWNSLPDICLFPIYCQILSVS